MKALRMAVVGLLIATQALAAPTGKLLIVEQDVTGTVPRPYSARRSEAMLRSTLDVLGVNYKGIDARTMKVEWGKTGVVGWGWGKTVADSCTFCETFNAVLWHRMNFGAPLVAGGARGDSLVNSGRVFAGSGSGLAVPNLFLLDDHLLAGSGQTMQATCCTTGVKNMDSGDLWVYGLQRPVGSLYGWFTAGLFQRTMTRKVGTTASGGYRPMLVANMPASYVYTNVSNCAFCDSIPGANAATGNDSVIVFQLPFSNVTGSKPAIVAYADGNGEPPGDSLSNAEGVQQPAEVDPTVMLYALAVLDSASGGTLFDKDKLPIKLGLVIEAAGVYGANRAGPGIPPQDSANLIATIDSLVALNARGGVQIRPTVAINLAGISGAGDSLDATGAYSSAWLDRWRRIGGVKFTPQSWFGVLRVEDRRASSGVGDVLGFADARTFVGDFNQTAGTADTSVAQMLKWAKRLLIQAGVDPNEMSKTLVAPLLDWAPVNKNTAADIDSALYAFRLAGFTTVISDANLPQSNPDIRSGMSMTSATYRGVSNGLMGYTSIQGRYKDAGGGLVNVLASNGHDITGGTMQVVVEDSSNASTFQSIILRELYRVVGGLLTPGDNWNVDYLPTGTDFTTGYFANFKDKLIAHTLIYPNGPTRYVPEKANILRLTAADLSGCTGCARGAPARNGWWIIKSLKNWMDAVNNAAGRTVITFDYPENIAP